MIHADVAHGFSADFGYTVATFKAFMRVRAMMIEKPRFPNGRTSIRAMKGRLWTLVAAVNVQTFLSLHHLIGADQCNSSLTSQVYHFLR